MNQQVCEQIKRAVWNSGNGVVTDQTIQIIAEAVLKEFSSFISQQIIEAALKGEDTEVLDAFGNIAK